MQLVTKRLLLREFEGDDWLALTTFRADPLVARYADEDLSTPALAQAWINWRLIHDREQPRTGHAFAIILQGNQPLIGELGIGLASHPTIVGEYNFTYSLARPYWGNGFMAEALCAVVDFYFQDMHAQRIYAECNPANTQSARVMEKVGMHYEGACLQPGIIDSAQEPGSRYALTRGEWKRRRR